MGLFIKIGLIAGFKISNIATTATPSDCKYNHFFVGKNDVIWPRVIFIFRWRFNPKRELNDLSSTVKMLDIGLKGT